MWHVICMQVNQGNFQLLVVKSGPDPSFGHNLCLNTQMGHANPF